MPAIPIPKRPMYGPYGRSPDPIDNRPMPDTPPVADPNKPWVQGGGTTPPRWSIGPMGALVPPTTGPYGTMANSQNLGPGVVPPTTPTATGDLGTVAGVTARFDAEHNAANAANEARYNQILGGYGDQKAGYQKRQDDIMSMLANNGVQEKADIEQSGRDRQGAAAQDLVSRGLSATTIGSQTARGIDRSTNADLGRAAERQRAQQANVQAGLSADTLGVDANKLNFMERKTDNGPDFGSYASLISSLAASNANPGAPGAVGTTGNPKTTVTGADFKQPVSTGVGGVGYHDLPPGVNPYYTTGQPGQNAYPGQRLIKQKQTTGW